jgi:putative ABC transport system permease protein
MQDDRVYPHQGEILLSAVFEKNGVLRGDFVSVGKGSFKVREFLSGLSNTGFVELGDAQNALGMPGMINGVVLTTDGSQTEESIQSQLYSSLPVWSTLSTEKALQDTNDMLRLYYGFVDIIIVSGLLISLAIVFNFIMINVLERSREIATMRTIGMGVRSITAMLTMENLTVLGAGIALGSVMGLYLTGYFVTLFQSDIFVLTSRINISTYAQTGLLLIIVLLVSQLPGIRSVYRMDLAKTTKERVG